LLQAFRDGVDIHTQTARLMFGGVGAEISSDQRAIAKTINFSVLYGKTPYGLSQQMNIPQAEARKFIEDYFNHYPKVREYFDRCLETARRQGYVLTLTGRRRYLADLNNPNRVEREKAERMAINTPIQGTAADLIKLAMVRLDRGLKAEAPRARMILQVHDELVIEAPEEDCQKCRELIKKEMEGAMELSTALVVEVKTGLNWSEAH
jgi:DNA polymerase-1